MKIILVGESGSGKDSIASFLSTKYNLKLIKSFTTRTRRTENEDTYRFVTIEEYKISRDLGKIFESTKFGDNYYWTELDDFETDNWVIIVDPVGVVELKSKFKDATTIYIKTDYHIRLERINDMGRIERDKANFKMFPCDYILDNNESIKLTFSNLEKLVESWL
jgi:guanylate kinase